MFYTLFNLVRKTGEKLKICYDVNLMDKRKLIESQEVNDQTRLELILDLEKEVFALLVVSLMGETDEELEQVDMNDDEDEARRLFEIVAIMGFLATSPEMLRTMANNKVLKELFDVPAVTVVPMEELTE